MAGQKIGDAYVDLNARFDKLEAALGKVDKEMVKTMKRAEKSTDSLGSAFNKLGGIIAGAFTVQKIAQFTVESIKLAGELEGVRHAYERVADPALMDQLKEATRGTVSELELMKSVTNAANFGIAIERMPELLEFARRRAKDTGMEVDYLVRSLVTGLGRRSTLVLDNLGITAVQLREKMGGIAVESASIAQITEAVAEISKDAYDGYAEGVATAADKMQELNARGKDLQAQIGEKLTPKFTGLANTILDATEALNDFFAGNDEEIKNFDVGLDMIFNNSQKLTRTYGLLEEALMRTEGRGVTMAERWTILFDGFTAAQIRAAEAQRQLNSEIEESNRIYGTAIGPFQDLTLASDQYNKAILELRKSLGLGTPADNADNAAQNLREAYDALVKKQDEALNIDQWQAYQAQIDKVIDKFYGLREGVSSISTSGAESRQDAVSRLNNSLGITTEIDRANIGSGMQQIKQLNTSLQQTQELAGAISGAFMRVGDSVINAFGDANTALGQFAQNMGRVILDVLAQALAASMANAITGATGAAAVAGPFAPAVLPVTIATMVGSVMSAFAAIPAFAKGGIAPGGMALVGERGPELVNLPKGSMVYPNHETSSIMGKGGAGYLDVNVHGMLKGDKLYLAGERGANRLRR